MNLGTVTVRSEETAQAVVRTRTYGLVRLRVGGLGMRGPVALVRSSVVADSGGGAMTARPYVIEPPSLDPLGPDGAGRNRLRVDVMPPGERCRLLPCCWSAAWTAEHRPRHVRESWSLFELCRGTACSSCSVAQKREGERTRPFQSTVVRERYAEGPGGPWRPNIMNRRERGWGEKSYEYATWGAMLGEWDISVGDCGRDEHGVFYEVHRA